MSKIVEFLDECMSFAYSSSLSVLDVWVIMIIATFSSEYSRWIWLALVPWVWYSTKQKVKYD